MKTLSVLIRNTSVEDLEKVMPDAKQNVRDALQMHTRFNGVKIHSVSRGSNDIRIDIPKSAISIVDDVRHLCEQAIGSRGAVVDCDWKREKDELGEVSPEAAA